MTAAGEPGAAEPCAHCGHAVPAESSTAVSGRLRETVVVYCSEACRQAHLVAVALASPTCAVTGCDLDPAADVPFCDGHLDPALERGSGPRGRSSAPAA
jgi:hypothetical protein